MLSTWANWLEFHIDRSKTQIFFMSLSPTHFWGDEWGWSDRGNCYNESEPIRKHGQSSSWAKKVWMWGFLTSHNYRSIGRTATLLYTNRDGILSRRNRRTIRLATQIAYTGVFPACQMFGITGVLLPTSHPRCLSSFLPLNRFTLARLICYK